ncbi:MAG: hypothetical protein AAF581_07065 [Planctomycetota bacterium]
MNDETTVAPAAGGAEKGEPTVGRPFAGVGRFVVQAVVVLGVIAVGATVLFHDRPGWESLQKTALCFGWSAFWALVLGILGIWSIQKTLTCRPMQMAAFMFGGLLLRAGVLLGTQLYVFFFIDQEWGKRTLLTTVVFYMFVLFLELQHVRRRLQATGPGVGSSASST